MQSVLDKVKELGFDPEEFVTECGKLDNMMVQMHMDSSYGGGLQDRIKTLESYGIYPQLRLMKEKYGIDIPISLLGYDVIKLEARIDTKLQERRYNTDGR